jgi:aspartyl/asparaginyl-tRNA synthetase
MAIAADMERVYEIGPVFRAENSNTHRHLTEFTGLDLEMTIENHYHEVVDMLDGALQAIFHGLQKDYRREIETVRKLYPSEDLVFPEKTVRLHFSDGVQMLRDAGWTDDGHEIDMYEDFSTRTEKKLGELVKEKYNTDFYILGAFLVLALSRSDIEQTNSLLLPDLSIPCRIQTIPSAPTLATSSYEARRSCLVDSVSIKRRSWSSE